MSGIQLLGNKNPGRLGSPSLGGVCCGVVCIAIRHGWDDDVIDCCDDVTGLAES